MARGPIRNRGRLRNAAAVLAAAMLCTGAAPSWGQATATARGGQLYEQQCTGCHGKSVHDRNPRSARTVDEVRRFVERWSNEVGAHWNARQVDDVVLFLNERYYHYPCENGGCRRERVSSFGGAARAGVPQRGRDGG